MDWYKISQQHKKFFVVEFKPDRQQTSIIQSKVLSLDNEEQARRYVKNQFPSSVILSVKESGKYRVRFSPDFSSEAKDTAEEVVADSPEKAKETILKKYPNATFNGEPINLSVTPPKAITLPSAAEERTQRRLERTVFEPWETNNSRRRSLPKT